MNYTQNTILYSTKIEGNFPLSYMTSLIVFIKNFLVS